MAYLRADLHRKVSHVVALDESGEAILSRRFEHSREAFRRVFGELEPEPISVAFEATYGWGWFADLLADAGIEAHMAHPLATKAIGAGRVKNDAVDAATLAHLLRTNLLPEAPIAPPKVRELRRLVRMRASLVRIRSRLKCQVHAICADAGVPVTASDLFGRMGRATLETLTLPPRPASRLAANLRLIDDIAREIVAADREIVAAFRDDDRVRRLLPIPGIGILTAATIVAEVWDVGRFPSADHLASWAVLPRPNAARPTTSGAATSASKAAAGCAGRWSRPPRRSGPPGRPGSTGSPTRSRIDAAPRSRGWPSPAGSSPSPSMPSATSGAAGSTRRSRARRAGRSRRARV